MSMCFPHTCATRELLKERLTLDRANRAMSFPEARTIHERTLSYVHALLQQGCGAPALEPTSLSSHKRLERQVYYAHLTQARRGASLKDCLCEGQLLFNFDSNGDVFMR
jgi:hypothetical protein